MHGLVSWNRNETSPVKTVEIEPTFESWQAAARRVRRGVRGLGRDCGRDLERLLWAAEAGPAERAPHADRGRVRKTLSPSCITAGAEPEGERRPWSGHFRGYPDIPRSGIGAAWGLRAMRHETTGGRGAPRSDFPSTVPARRRERSARHETEEQQQRDVFTGQDV